MSADPALTGFVMRHDGDLHHRILREMHAIERDFGRMHPIFGIVEHDGGKTPPLGALILAQRVPHPVEIIAFCRWPGRRPDHQPHPPVARHQRGDRHQRRGIIGVAADIEPDILAIPASQHVGEGRGQHRRLAPRRHEDCNRPRNRIAHANRVAPRPASPEPERIEQEIVEPEQKDAHRCKQHQFMTGTLYQPAQPCGRPFHPPALLCPCL